MEWYAPEYDVECRICFQFANIASNKKTLFERSEADAVSGC